MMRRKLAISLCAVFVASSSTSAQVIIGNYPPTNDATQTAAINDLRQKAFSFTVPAGPDILIGDLTVRLRNYDIAGDSPVFEIRDHTGVATSPGTNVLFTFDTPAPGGAAIQDYTFAASNLFSLAGGTSYWLVGRGAAGGSFDWMASSPGIAPTGIATFGQTSFTSNGGGTWTTSTILSTFQIAVGIPEPTSVVLTGCGIAGAWWMRRRRK